MEKIIISDYASCPGASVEEKRKFSKRSYAENLNESGDASISGDNEDQERQTVDMKLANFFFRTGISFRLADSESFKDFVKSVNPVYASSLPSARKLAGPLLDAQYKKCFKLLQETIETSENLILISDGWTNIRGDHIVNFCIKAPGQKPFFHSSINTSGLTQNAIAVADAICNVIEEVGADKFSCVVTDNAAVMRAAWKIIEQKYPHISAMGCAAHGVNLLIKDILDTTNFIKIIKDSEKIIKFITNHHIAKAKYDEMRKLMNVSHTLTMAVATRWFSRFTSLNDLSSSKYVLLQLIDKHEDLLQEISPKATSIAAIKLIKTNEFWESLTKVVKAIEYPANIIGKFLSNCFITRLINSS